jgi:hypothetical protein
MATDRWCIYPKRDCVHEARQFTIRPLSIHYLPKMLVFQSAQSQRLDATDLGVCFQFGEGARGELDGSVGPDLPVRDEQRPGAGIEERPRHTGQRLCPFAFSAGGVAG